MEIGNQLKPRYQVGQLLRTPRGEVGRVVGVWYFNSSPDTTWRYYLAGTNERLTSWWPEDDLDPVEPDLIISNVDRANLSHMEVEEKICLILTANSLATLLLSANPYINARFLDAVYVTFLSPEGRSTLELRTAKGTPIECEIISSTVRD